MTAFLKKKTDNKLVNFMGAAPWPFIAHAHAHAHARPQLDYSDSTWYQLDYDSYSRNN